ncbi:hypothetical protein HDU96_004495, partial [Phlyctochytrium bullatum]
MGEDAGQPDDALFFIDKTKDPDLVLASLSVESEQPGFIPLGSQPKKRKKKQKSGKPFSKGKGKRKEDTSYENNLYKRPIMSDDDLDMSVYQDYIDNASEGELESISGLAYLSLDAGKALAVEDSCSSDEERVLAESGLYENLMAADDEEELLRENFTGGRSLWDADPSRFAKEKAFTEVLE